MCCSTIGADEFGVPTCARVQATWQTGYPTRSKSRYLRSLLTLRAAKPAKSLISRRTPVLPLSFKIGDNSRTVGLNLRYGIFRLRIEAMSLSAPSKETPSCGCGISRPFWISLKRGTAEHYQIAAPRLQEGLRRWRQSGRYPIPAASFTLCP